MWFLENLLILAAGIFAGIFTLRQALYHSTEFSERIWFVHNSIIIDFLIFLVMYYATGYNAATLFAIKYVTIMFCDIRATMSQ